MKFRELAYPAALVLVSALAWWSAFWPAGFDVLFAFLFLTAFIALAMFVDVRQPWMENRPVTSFLWIVGSGLVGMVTMMMAFRGLRSFDGELAWVVGPARALLVFVTCGMIGIAIHEQTRKDAARPEPDSATSRARRGSR